MTSLNSNNEFLTHIGIVAPFKAGKSDAAIAIGYYMDGDYDNDMDFSGFNSNPNATAGFVVPPHEFVSPC